MQQKVPVQRYITALVNKKEVKKGRKVTKKSRFRMHAPATEACSSVQSPPRTVKVIAPS